MSRSIRDAAGSGEARRSDDVKNKEGNAWMESGEVAAGVERFRRPDRSVSFDVSFRYRDGDALFFLVFFKLNRVSCDILKPFKYVILVKT